MDETPSEPNEPPPFARTRRRWFRFSLRTMLVAITLFCIWLGVTAYRANRQRKAVETIRSYRAYVRYDYELADNGWEVRRDNPLPPGPVWLRDLIGIDYFATAVNVCMDHGNDVNDDSISALAELSQVRRIDIEGANVTDAVMAKLKGLKQLRELIVINSSVTESGWDFLRHLTRLRNLALYGSNVTDSTLIHIDGLTELTSLTLHESQITDAGLRHLKGLTQLEYLELHDPLITDASLQHLKELTGLKQLDIRSTKITSDGIDELKRALPKLKVGAL
jgi:hypothetical protein